MVSDENQSEPNETMTQQILFINDLEKLLGRNRITIRRWWMSGKFPTPVKLNGTTLAWSTEAIHDWIDRNIKATN